MSLRVAVPKTYQPGRHVIVPTKQFRQKIGVVDAESGQEISHAHLRAWLTDFLGEPLIRLINHSVEHADDPDHPYHQDAHEAFHARVKGLWHIDRYDAPLEFYAAKASKTSLVTLTEAQLEADPHWIQKYPALYAEAMKLIAQDKQNDASEFEDDFENIFTTNGVNTLWTIANAGVGAANSGSSAAAATAAFNTTQSRIGVGDGTTAGAASDTDIQGTVAANKWWVVVSSAPSITTNQMAFTGSYGTAAANYAWQNFAVDNCGGSNAVTGAASGTRSGGTMLDHVASNQGTKASGQTWNPTLTLSIS